MNKTVLLLSLLFVNFSLFANEAAVVTEVSGNVFAFNHLNKAVRLHQNDSLLENMEIMLEDGASLTFADFDGHQFSLSGGAQAKIKKNTIALKNGHLWVVSKNNQKTFLIETANAHTSYRKSQFVVSFDSYTGKSQLLVLEGPLRFSNAFEPLLNVDITSGDFSIVDSSYQKGSPRAPVRIGLNSYKSLRSHFGGSTIAQNSNFRSGMVEPANSRSIASVSAPVHVKKVSHESALHYYHKNFKSKKVVPVSRAKVRVFGFKKKASSIKIKATAPKKVLAPKKVKRVPASISQSLVHDLDSAFEKSLESQNAAKQRHPKEVNSLIDELKSYKQNYSKDY